MLIHFIVFLILLVNGSWVGVLINLPVVLFRAYQISTCTYELDPAVLAGGGRGARGKTSIPFEYQLYFMLLVYASSSLYSFVRLLNA
jgi:hypothetical protein